MLVEHGCASNSVRAWAGVGHLVGTLRQYRAAAAAGSATRSRVSQIMDEIRGPAGRTMWDKLGNVHEAVLANYLKNEYPQTVAVVLSKVRPDHAARVLMPCCPTASPSRS